MDGDNLSRLKLLSFDGLSEQQIIKAKAFRGMKAPAWSPDGNWIAYTKGEGDGKSLRLIRPDGTGERLIYYFVGGEPGNPDSTMGLHWVPSETDRIVWTAWDSQVYVISTLDPNPTPRSILSGTWQGVTLSPDLEPGEGYQGAMAFIDSGFLTVARAEDQAGLGLHVDLSSSVVAGSLTDGTAFPSWSHDGLEIAFLYRNFSIPDFGNSLDVMPVLVDSTGITLSEYDVRTIYDSALEDAYGPYHAVYHRPAWSPDDSLVGFCAQVGGEPDGSKAFDLLRVNADGSGLVNVTNGSMRPIFMDWNPNWEFDLP